MTKKEEIKQAIQNILNTCPHYNNKVYLLEDYKFGMGSIDVMFNTLYNENKCIKLDKNGAYIMGRGQDQGDKHKMYIHEFDNIELSNDTLVKLDEYQKLLVKKLDERIPSKDIKVGDICNQFIKDKDKYHVPSYRCLYLYVGRRKITITHRDDCRGTVVNKYNVYVDMGENKGKGNEFKYQISKGVNKKDYIEHEYWLLDTSNKIRFDKKLNKVDMDVISLIREEYERNECKGLYNAESDFEWLD